MCISKTYENHIEQIDEEALRKELESLKRAVDIDKEWKYRSEIKVKIRFVKSTLFSLLGES